MEKLESISVKLPRVIKSRSVQRVLELALVLLENHLTDEGLSEHEIDMRENCIDDLQVLLKNGFE